jgi:putative transposase
VRAAEEVVADVGVRAACVALGVSTATLYRRRHRNEQPQQVSKPRPPPDRALSPAERQAVLDVLHSERFVDKAPGEVYATLLDEGRRLCSIRTMYRILKDAEEVRERRNQLRHPTYAEPQLEATAPNRVWTWDITKLAGAKKWQQFQLYAVIDIFSRYIVAWRLERRENSHLAKEMMAEACRKQSVQPGQLTIHADRGSSMKSKTLAQLFADLGVTKSHSRPRVSNDNPFSESHFKTLKNRPDFPARFGSLEDGRVYCRAFFDWYNTAHYHSGIALLTPEQVHHGLADEVLDARHKVLLAAYETTPERFVHGPPVRTALPAGVWINEPVSMEVTK